MTYTSLSQDLLKQNFNYDPETGWFTWKDRSKSHRANNIAGGVDGAGYIRLRVGNQSCAAHRAAWVYVFGSIPDNLMIDHINGDRSDNRIRNLRVVTPLENSKNQLPRRENGAKRERKKHVVNAKFKILDIPSVKKQKTQVLKKEKPVKKISRLSLMLQKNDLQ